MLQVGVYVCWTYLVETTPGGLDRDAPVLPLLGLMLFMALASHLVGIALGVVGLSAERSPKLEAGAGLLINVVGFLFMYGLYGGTWSIRW